jgi:hypothetical protein
MHWDQFILKKLKWPHLVIFKGFISLCPTTFTAQGQGHW